MKAITITDKPEPIQLEDLPKPNPGNDECLIRIKAAALNRRDQWMREGLYPGIKPGVILGSDGCGRVEEGPAKWKGKEVIINPNIDWGENPDAQSSDYKILGMPANGTLSEYMVVTPDRLFEKPDYLSATEAAAVPLAGLTAYRAVFTKGDVGKGKRVLITGIGGGVSQFALKFAVAAGAEVYVTSRSEDKTAKARAIGARDGYNVQFKDWWKDVVRVGRFDTIIDSTGGNGINDFLKIIRPGGRIVIYGSTRGYPEKLDVFRLFWSQAHILGSTMGNDDEFAQMVRFISKKKIEPTIDEIFKAEEYLRAFDRFKAREHFGKIVMTFE